MPGALNQGFGFQPAPATGGGSILEAWEVLAFAPKDSSAPNTEL